MIPITTAISYAAHPNLALNFGFFQIRVFDLMFILACLVSPIVGLILARKKKKNMAHASWTAFLLGLGILIGSKLFFIVPRWSWFIEQPSNLHAILNSGYVSYGGIIVGVMFVFIYSILLKINFLEYADFFGVGGPLSHLVMRVGCFLNGCCYGKPTTMPWGVNYLNTVRHPTQVYHIIANILVFIVLLRLTKKKNFKGFLFFSYIFLYCSLRFIIDFFRYYPEKYIFLSLTFAQYFCIAGVIFSGFMIYRKSNKLKNIKI